LTSQFLNGFLLVAQDAAVKMGAWQMVLWQPRWVYAEVDGFCYQKISTAEVICVRFDRSWLTPQGRHS